MRRLRTSFVAAVASLAVAGSALTATAQDSDPASEISFLSDLDGYEFELYQPAPGGE